MCIILTVWSANKSIRETALFHQDDVLYPEERVIDGENISIWGKDVITAVDLEKAWSLQLLIRKTSPAYSPWWIVGNFDLAAAYSVLAQCFC